jgi:hypothetical protein
MNKRIQELAESAYDIVEFNYAPSQKIFNKEKFAQLIVQECVNIANEYVRDGHSSPTARSAIGISINKKLGDGNE